MSNYSRLHLKVLQDQLLYLEKNRIHNHRYSILKELEANNWTKKPAASNKLKPVPHRKSIKVKLNTLTNITDKYISVRPHKIEEPS